MDERLANALEFTKLQHTLYLEKKRIQAKLHRDLELAYGGGIFTIDRNFIVFLEMFNPDEDGSVTILDNNLNPIVISNPEDFKNEVRNTYFRAVNRYRVDFENIKNKRTIKGIVDL